VFTSTSAFVTYDLGAPKPIRAAYLQGDNNDDYTLSISDDGSRWSPLWTAGPVSDSGLRPRATAQLNATARYVRVGVRGGDRSYALSEVQLFSEPPSPFPPRLDTRRGVPLEHHLRGRILTFALAIAFFLFATSRRASLLWTGLCFLAPVFAGIDMVVALADQWPVAGRQVSFVRGTTAAIAALAILRELAGRVRFPASRFAVFSSLGLAAAGALLAFYNLGRPQFYDHDLREPCYVHNFDMRVYYPVAKYFPELGFDGLYQGSVAAYVDDVPDVTLDSLDGVELRDLRTHRMTRVAQVKDQIRVVKERFSPERWQAFVRDMRYFRLNMGTRDYLGSMHDHGGNATPVWLALTHLLFSPTTASNETLLMGALLDPILLLIAFVVIGRTFGWRTMLVSAVVFGANDFYMFGSNWGGATLRHDWLAYLALGVCALKSQRWLLGGALLALSASIRAFPAMAFVGMVIPLLWWVAQHLHTSGTWPRLRDVRDAQRPLLRTLAGAAVSSIVLFLASSAILSFSAWPTWLAKVRLLDRDPHVNHVSWRGLVAGSDHFQIAAMHDRMALYACGIALAVVIIALAVRTGRIAHAAVLGTLLIPMAFNPANYYIHFIIVLPLLALEGAGQREDAAPPISWHDAGIWLSLLLMCVALYWSTLEVDLELHFQYATALYFAGIVAMMAVILHRDRAAAFAALPGWSAGDSGASESRPTLDHAVAASDATASGAAHREGDQHTAEDLRRSSRSAAPVVADALDPTEPARG
jgi:hypothetical protein